MATRVSIASSGKFLRALRTGALLCLIAGCDRGAGGESRFEVTGSFRPDGSCDIQVDGRSLAPGRSSRTTYAWGDMINVAPAGLVVHDLGCELEPTASKHGIHATRFGIMAAVPEGRLLVEGTYSFRADATLHGDTTSVEGVVFHPKFAQDGAGGNYLLSEEGTLTLTSVTRAGTGGDGVLVTGSFHFMARPRSLGM